VENNASEHLNQALFQAANVNGQNFFCRSLSRTTSLAQLSSAVYPLSRFKVDDRQGRLVKGSCEIHRQLSICYLRLVAIVQHKLCASSPKII